MTYPERGASYTHKPRFIERMKRAEGGGLQGDSEPNQYLNPAGGGLQAQGNGSGDESTGLNIPLSSGDESEGLRTSLSRNPHEEEITGLAHLSTSRKPTRSLSASRRKPKAVSVDSDDPTNTGGGSLGYNRGLTYT